MRVLRRGTPPEELVHYCECTRCKSVLQFLRGEAKYQDDQRDGDYLSISCPVCKHHNNVDLERSLINPLASTPSFGFDR